MHRSSLLLVVLFTPLGCSGDPAPGSVPSKKVETAPNSGQAPAKTGKSKRLPVGDEVAAWIESQVDAQDRLRAAPLFPNPRTGRPYAHKTLQAIWRRALEEAGLPHVPLYEGTKHSFATDAIRRGVPERLLQKFLGHANPESTRRYARLADNALVQVLRPREEPAWRQAGDKGSENRDERSREVSGGPSWTRTRDQPVMSRPL